MGCLTGGLLFGFHVRCGHYLAVFPPVWCNHDLHSTRRDFVLNIFYTGGTMRYIHFTLIPTSRRGGVFYRFSVPCAWDSWFTLVFVLDLHNAWPPFCGDMRYNRWVLPGPYLSNRDSGAPVTGAAGGCVRTLCGVALFVLVLCCPRCLRHTTETIARTRVHAHTQNRPCPHGSCGAGSRAFWNMSTLHYPFPGCSV